VKAKPPEVAGRLAPWPAPAREHGLRPPQSPAPPLASRPPTALRRPSAACRCRGSPLRPARRG